MVKYGIRIIEEKYNSDIHCCEYWYKDFCECTKKYKKPINKIYPTADEAFGK